MRKPARQSPVRTVDVQTLRVVAGGTKPKAEPNGGIVTDGDGIVLY
jgi:hypothetical protein